MLSQYYLWPCVLEFVSICHKLALCRNVLLDPALCYDEILVSKVPNKVLSSGFCPNL